MNWTYFAIMATAVGTGLVLFRRTREPLGLNVWEKLGLALGAFCGGMLGAKLPFALADWPGFVSGAAWFDDGKTIMSGLVGGYLGAQVAEWSLGVRVNLGDSLAGPVAAAIGIGRLACFAGGCCYGTETSLPWGVNFGDGLCRHPTQLYEAAFHLSAAVVLFQLQGRPWLRGRRLQAYFVAYFVYRFVSEFIRPEPALWLGLTGYQWAALVLAPFFTFWTCPGCRPSRLSPPWPKSRWRTAATPPSKPALAGGAPPDPDRSAEQRFLKHTLTRCPTCRRQLAGTTFEQQGQVFLNRDCPEHGPSLALVSSDRRLYWLRDEVPHPPLSTPAPGHESPGESPASVASQPGDAATEPRPAPVVSRLPPLLSRCCSPAPEHRTCVALLEVTEACNLHCPVCFAQSPRGGHRPFVELRADLEAFLARRGPLDVLQLSGGEPLLHPELLRIIDHCYTLPIDQVMLNTNGLALLQHESLAAELARRRSRLELNLQFDGLDQHSHVALRDAKLLPSKQAVLQKILDHDLRTTLVCTVVRGVNELQLGPLLKLGLETRPIRGLTFQPATFSGRFEIETDPLRRLTLADIVHRLVEQSGGLLAVEDFNPLPCSNPNCCSFTFVARPKHLPIVPLTRLTDYKQHVDRLADRMNFKLEDARECCGTNWRAEDFFRVVIKPFMDVYTYDQERIDECCVHVIRPGGDAVSFCQFNALERTGGS